MARRRRAGCGQPTSSLLAIYAHRRVMRDCGRYVRARHGGDSTCTIFQCTTSTCTVHAHVSARCRCRSGGPGVLADDLFLSRFPVENSVKLFCYTRVHLCALPLGPWVLYRVRLLEVSAACHVNALQVQPIPSKSGLLQDQRPVKGVIGSR